MIVEHFLLAQSSSVDRESNSLSIFNLIEEIAIQVPQGREAHVPAQAIIVFHREEELGEFSCDVTFEVLSPNEEALVQQQLTAHFGPKHKRQRLRLNFAFPVPQSGDYCFRLSGDEGVLCELQIPVQAIPQIRKHLPEQ